MNTNFPPISRQQFAVLRFLTASWPIAAAQIEVAIGANFESRQTAAKRLAELSELGLVEHQKKLRGYIATDKGRRLVQHTAEKFNTDCTCF